MSVSYPEVTDGQLALHLDTAYQQLTFYAAISVRVAKLADGSREYTYYLNTISSPGGRLVTHALGGSVGGCDHLTCNLEVALDEVREREANVLAELAAEGTRVKTEDEV